MPITGISHVAYRCASAAKTVEFYSGVLGMPYRYAIAENKVPSTGEHFPHIHIFIEIASGTYLGFFELADAPPLGFAPNILGQYVATQRRENRSRDHHDVQRSRPMR